MTAIRRKKVNVPTLIGRGITMLILIGLSILVLIPLVWTVCMALKPAGEIYNGRFFPTTLVWGNFVEAVTSIDFFQYLLNTLKVVIPNVIGQVISCSLVAYGFSRYNFKGKRVWFLILLATMMIPGTVTMVPNYIILRVLGLLDTYTGLVLPKLAYAFGVFLMRQSMLAVNDAYMESAFLDGATLARIFRSIMLPMVVPTLATMTLLSFMGSWNSYLWPLIVLTSTDKQTLQVVLGNMNGMYKNNEHVLMAGAVLTILPILVVYLISQKYVDQGISLGGLK